MIGVEVGDEGCAHPCGPLQVNWNFVDGKKLVLIKEYAVDDPAKAAWLQVHLLHFLLALCSRVAVEAGRLGREEYNLSFTGIG